MIVAKWAKAVLCCSKSRYSAGIAAMTVSSLCGFLASRSVGAQLRL
jgi:hypothetical protein